MAGENSKSWVRVPIQYPTASCHSMSLDVALYSHEPNRIGEKRTRLTVRPRPRRGPAFHAAALDPDDQADDQHHGTRRPGPTHRPWVANSDAPSRTPCQRTGNAVGGHPSRGFESHPLRQLAIL